jgi:hypothetical protein
VVILVYLNVSAFPLLCLVRDKTKAATTNYEVLHPKAYYKLNFITILLGQICWMGWKKGFKIK